ncbi:MAG: energy transducer TonB, partial [Rhizonema sp. PD37]|nr:energy transducer TonB [Rhizonema sp. PD37]
SNPPIPPPPIPVPKEPLVQPSPLEKFVDNFKVPPTQPPKPVAEAPPIIPPATPQPEITTPITPPPESVRTQRVLPPSTDTPLASVPGNNLIGVPKNGLSQGSGNGVGNGIGNGRGNGVGNGIGNGVGNGVGNGIGNGVGNGSKPGQTIATAPKPPTPKPKPKSTRLNLSKDCVRCELTYPDSAKQRGIEGSPEVSIDYDENGHVTNVRLTQPSGKSELDQAVMEQAREFVLKPVSGGRVGARVVANFHMRGSDRDREYQARQRKRDDEARARQRETLTSTTPTQEETPPSNRRKRAITPATPETPATNSSPQVSPQGVEPNSSNLSTPSDTLNQSPENRSENGNRKPRKLDDSSTQSPIQSPSVPTSQP